MDTYYKCPHCNKESEAPGFCQHGKASVALKECRVVENPVNHAKLVGSRLAINDVLFGRFVPVEDADVTEDDMTHEIEDTGTKYDPLFILMEVEEVKK